MRKAPPQDSQRSNQRDYLPSPLISVFTLKVLSVLAAILGTACTLTHASKPQQAPRPTTSNQTAAKLPKDISASRSALSTIVQPTASETLQHLLSPANRSIKKQVEITPELLYSVDFSCDTNTLSAANQRPNQKRQQDDFGQQEVAALKLAPELALLYTVGLKSDQPLQNNQNNTLTQVNSPQLLKGQLTEPIVETRLIPNQQESPPQGREARLTLSDIVILVLQNNRLLKNAYLERIAQREDLAVAEGKFLPNVTPSVSVSIAQFGSDKIMTNGGFGAGATVSVRVPTGGELAFSWAVNSQTPELNSLGIDTNGDLFEPNLQLSFKQPLLRGAGINLNRASIDIARLNEQINIQNLKLTLIDTITNAIFAYRNLIQAQEQLKIDRQSLELAQQILEVNRVLIEAGRVAPVDIVQSQTAVANRQVSLLNDQNNLEASKLALIDVLDIDQNLNIVAAEIPIAKRITLDSNKLRQLAFTNRPAYLIAQLNQRTSQLELLLAEDEKRWDLNLVTSVNNRLNSYSDVRGGLLLSREFGDLTKKQRFVRSQVNLLQAENTLRNLDDSIKIQVTDAIRDVTLRFSLVERARQARELSERQLEIAREKQRLGGSFGIFELVRLQNDLVNARNVELNATIDYLNALTRLDQTLGTTLDTWQVTLDRQQ